MANLNFFVDVWMPCPFFTTFSPGGLCQKIITIFPRLFHSRHSWSGSEDGAVEVWNAVILTLNAVLCDSGKVMRRKSKGKKTRSQLIEENVSSKSGKIRQRTNRQWSGSKRVELRFLWRWYSSRRTIEHARNKQTKWHRKATYKTFFIQERGKLCYSPEKETDKR